MFINKNEECVPDATFSIGEKKIKRSSKHSMMFLEFKEELARLKQANYLRLLFAVFTICFVSYFTHCILCVVVKYINVPDTTTVLVALLTNFSVQVLGMVYCCLKYLFPEKL